MDELSTDKLSFTLNGKTSEQTNVGTYEEQDIKSINYGNLDVTKSATVKYSITVDTETKEFTTKSELETYINTLPAGTYTIKYNVTYLGISTSKTRTVTLK